MPPNNGVTLVVPSACSLPECKGREWTARLPAGLKAKQCIGMIRKDPPRNVVNDDVWLVSTTKESVAPTPFARYLRNGRKVSLLQRPKKKEQMPKRFHSQRRPSTVSQVLRRSSIPVNGVLHARRSSVDSSASRITSYALLPHLKNDFPLTLVEAITGWLRVCGVYCSEDITVTQGPAILDHLYRYVQLTGWIHPATLKKEADHVVGDVKNFCNYLKTSKWREMLADKWVPILPGRCPAGHALWAMRCGQGPGKIGKAVRCQHCDKYASENIVRCSLCDVSYCTGCRPCAQEIEAFSALLPFTENPDHCLPQGGSVVSYTNDKLRKTRLLQSVKPSQQLHEGPSPSCYLAPMSIHRVLRDAMAVMYYEKHGDILDELLSFVSTTTPYGTTFNEFHTVATLVEVWSTDKHWYSHKGEPLLYFASMLLTQSGADLDRFLGHVAPPPYTGPSSEWARYRPINISHVDKMRDVADKLLTINTVQSLDAVLEALKPYIKTLVTLAVMAEPYNGTLSVPASSVCVEEGHGYCMPAPAMCALGEEVDSRHTIHINSNNDVHIIPFLGTKNMAITAPMSCFTVESCLKLDGKDDDDNDDNDNDGSIVKATGDECPPFVHQLREDVAVALEAAFLRMKDTPPKGSVLRNNMAEFWLCVSAVHNATKALQTMNTLRNFERSVNESAMEQFMFLFNLLECMDEPMKVLMQLQCREQTMKYVDPQVRMAKRSIEAVEIFLGEDLPKLEGDDEEDEERLGWTTWLTKKKDGKEKKEQLSDISGRLQKTIEAMNLGLMTLQMAIPERLREPQARFNWQQSVHDDAVAMWVELSTGRVTRRAICAGQLWEHSTSNTTGSGLWVDKRRCCFVLGSYGDDWEVEVLPAPETQLRDHEAGFEGFKMKLNKSLEINRYWGGDAMAALKGLRGVRNGSIVYHIKNNDTELVLQFEAIDRMGTDRSQRCITAELFEMLVFLIISNSQDEVVLRKLMTAKLDYLDQDSRLLVDAMGNLRVCKMPGDFPRAVPKRKPYETPHAVTDDLLVAVRQIPHSHRYVTAKLLPDGTMQTPSSLLSLVDAFLQDTKKEGLMCSLPPDDCRVVFSSDNTLSMFLWVPPTTHQRVKNAYLAAVPALMSIFGSTGCQNIIGDDDLCLT